MSISIKSLDLECNKPNCKLPAVFNCIMCMGVYCKKHCSNKERINHYRCYGCSKAFKNIGQAKINYLKNNRK
jgi:hypothetical protein